VQRGANASIDQVRSPTAHDASHTPGNQDFARSDHTRVLAEQQSLLRRACGDQGSCAVTLDAREAESIEGNLKHHVPSADAVLLLPEYTRKPVSNCQ
jgi:hypothetical protein